MKCNQCGERWSLECTLGPGGAASPGHVFVVAIIAAVVAVGSGMLFSPLAGTVFGVLSLLIFVNCLFHCGYQEPATAYQGSTCPKCGARNFIWPWNT
jgi:hypothetical protein